MCVCVCVFLSVSSVSVCVCWLMKALELNSRDSWSSHTIAHVMEMRGQHDDGLKFLESTVNDWQVSDVSGL